MTNTGVVTTGGDLSIDTQALTECLKTQMQFKGDVIHNICEGTQYFVPYGFWDYTTAIILILFTLILLVGFARMVLD